MSSYNTRHCSAHGEWEQDVDHPYDECPECEAEGNAPSQLADKWKDRAIKAMLLAIDYLNADSTPLTNQDVVEALKAAVTPAATSGVSK